MRILLVDPWDEEFGGVVSVIGNLARYLKGQGHEVIFLHPSNTIIARRKTTKWGFTGFELRLQAPFGKRHPVVSMMLFLFLFPIGIYQLIRIIQRHRIDIVNIHFPQDYCLYFALCRQILPIRLVTSVHGADFFPDGKAKASYSRAIRFVLGSSDRIVAPSRGYQEDFSAIFPEVRDATTFVHNGVNLAELLSDGQTTNTDQDPYIFCIAQHVEKKGLDVLLHAFEQLRHKHPSFKLVIAGDGPLRGQLQQLAISLRIDEKVEFLGQKGRSEIVKLLQGCQVFVLPSRSEPFGIAIVEALACGKPVVATAVGGIPEVIENGKNGILVEPDNSAALADALIRVLTNQALQRLMARNGPLTVKGKFRCENTGLSYEAIFGALLNSSQSSFA